MAFKYNPEPKPVQFLVRPTTKKNFVKAVARYNSMRTRAQNKWDLSYLPPSINTNEILSSIKTTEELNQITKSLNDYKSISDFLESERVPFQATRGEIRTFTRERAARVRRATIQAKKLRAEVKNQSAKEMLETAQRIKELETKPVSLKQLRDKKSFLQAIRSSKKDNLKFDYTMFQSRQFMFINSIQNIEELTGLRMAKVKAKLMAMSVKEFYNWLKTNSDLISVDISPKYFLEHGIQFENTQSFDDLNKIANSLNVPLFSETPFDGG